MRRWIVGIDEVGRGALAGPLVVAAVAAPANSKWLMAYSRDSKQLTSCQREDFFASFRKRVELFSIVASASPRVVDRVGITAAAASAVRRALETMRYMPYANERFVFLDGGLSAPKKYRQLTVVRGDAQIPVIAAASIVAKVHRDTLMRRAHKLFPQYGFDEHVGYGTKQHYKALRRHGPSPIHRKSSLILH